MSGKIIIPENKRVNIKLYIIQKHPSSPFGYNFDHFTRKQCKLIGKLLDKINDNDLDIDKFFDLYGIYAYERKIKDVPMVNISSSEDLDVDEFIRELLERENPILEQKKKFHKKYCLDRRHIPLFEEGPENEYERILNLEGVSDALYAIYEIRFFKN